MAENINGTDLLGSGGHVWIWDSPDLTRKSVGSVAIRGTYGQVTAIGARTGRIAGKNGTNALLRASGGSRAAADAALTALEATIESLVESGEEVAWGDDAGHTGTALVLTGYARSGHRLYGVSGAVYYGWQEYGLPFEERNGGW